MVSENCTPSLEPQDHAGHQGLIPATHRTITQMRLSGMPNGLGGTVVVGHGFCRARPVVVFWKNSDSAIPRAAAMPRGNQIFLGDQMPPGASDPG